MDRPNAMKEDQKSITLPIMVALAPNLAATTH